MRQFKGQITEFPEPIVEAMLKYQVLHGNPRDVTVFGENVLAIIDNGGFNWDSTTEGMAFWRGVLCTNNFKLFFKKLETKVVYPKVMLVSDNKINWYTQVVYMEKCGKFLAWANAETIEDSLTEVSSLSWEFAKDIEKLVPLELTLDQIAEKFGVNINFLKIKNK